MEQIDVLRERETMLRALYKGCERGGKFFIPLAIVGTSLTFAFTEGLEPAVVTFAFVTTTLGIGCAACAEVFGSRLKACQNEILFLQDDTNS